MGRLFWKIFAWYWLAALALVILGAWATQQVASLSDDARTGHPPEAREAVRAAIRAQTLVQSLAERLSAGDLAGARTRLGRARAGAFVVDASGTEILGRPLPPGAAALLSGRAPLLPDRWLVEAVSDPAGHRYTVIARVASHRSARRPPGGMATRTLRPFVGPRRWRDYWWVRLGVALAVSGVVCYLLARHLAGPVQRLRSATRQVAAGDLSVRVGASLGGRRDEIADLARDFDVMTERLDALVTSQQRLLRDIAHELRSPLARLRVALELARQRAGGKADDEHARIELETERLSDLIGQLLELERLSQPIAQERTEVVDLAAVVREVVEDASFEGQASGVAIACRADDEARIRGQAAQLRSAIENVVRNACRYSPEGSTVRVSLDLDRAGGTALVRVRDEGPGVPDTSLEHLFEPFYRVDSARSRRQGGHGLGLAIAARIARRHRGAIEAVNATGGGLEVTLQLPLMPG